MNRPLSVAQQQKLECAGVGFGLPVKQLLEVLSIPSHAFDWPKQ